MIEVETIVTIGEDKYFGELGVVKSTMLGLEDHNIFTFMLDMDFAGSGQGMGGYALDTYDSAWDQRIGVASGTDLVLRILEHAGVRQWESLKGLQLLVLRETQRGPIVGFINPKVGTALLFDEHYDQWKGDKD